MPLDTILLWIVGLGALIGIAYYARKRELFLGTFFDTRRVKDKLFPDEYRYVNGTGSLKHGKANAPLVRKGDEPQPVRPVDFTHKGSDAWNVVTSCVKEMHPLSVELASRDPGSPKGSDRWSITFMAVDVKTKTLQKYTLEAVVKGTKCRVQTLKPFGSDVVVDDRLKPVGSMSTMARAPGSEIDYAALYPTK